MAKLEEHYKDRQPEETINIIKNFFYKKGYKIEFNYITSCIGVESCHIDLYKDNYIILQSNGKGIDKNYALASGLGELYERFCIKGDVYSTPYLLNIFTNKNYNKYGYYYDKTEKIVSIDQLNLPPVLQKHFTTLFGNNQEIMNNFFSFKTNNKFIEVPFINAFNTNDTIFLNIPLLLHLTGTNGFAAGNNFYEAFNQGASELMERYCFSLLCELKDTYYSIDINSIKNKKLKYLLNEIKKDNNEITILDLSYTYNLPVIALITFNKITLNTTLILGSFPIFEIALERCITETYQNCFSYTNKEIQLNEPMINFSKQKYIFKEQAMHSSIQTLFPFQLYDNIKKKNNYNYNCFLKSSNYSNKKIYKWILNKLKENNISLFYRDISLDKQIYAIQLFSNEMSEATAISQSQILDYDKDYMLEVLKDLEKLNQNFYKFCLTNDNKYLLQIMNFYYKKTYNSSYDILTENFGHQILFMPSKIPTDYYYMLTIMLKIIEKGIQSLNNEDLVFLRNLVNIKEFRPIKQNLIFYITLIKYLKYFDNIQDVIKNFKYFNTNKNIEFEINNLLNDNLYFLKQTFFYLCNEKYNNLLNLIYNI